MATSYLPRRKAYTSYVPWLSILGFCTWVTGVILWVHYTYLAYNRSTEVLEILQVTATGGALANIDRVVQDLKATVILYTLLAVCIHALAIWRGLLEAKQDATGVRDEVQGLYFKGTHIVLSTLWWLITIWVGMQMILQGVFAGGIYLANSQIQNILYLQSQLPSGTVPVFANSLCPEACLDMPSTGLFLYTRDKQSAAVKNWCACDPNMLQAAGSELQDASKAVPGFLVGVMLMLLYSVVLQCHLSWQYGQIRHEEEFAERLESAGRGESRGLARSTHESYALPTSRSFKKKTQQPVTRSLPVEPVEESDYE